jgi:hypothetical protein
MMYRYCFNSEGECVAKIDDVTYQKIGGDEDHKLAHLKLICNNGNVIESEDDKNTLAIKTSDGKIISDIAMKPLSKEALITNKLKDMAEAELIKEGVLDQNGKVVV